MAKNNELRKIYSELNELKSEMAVLRSVILPEEQLTKAEIRELHKIEAEMKRGKENALKK